MVLYRNGLNSWQSTRVKTIVCLANSFRPPGGRCIAGREIGTGASGAWIRPVSARATRELATAEIQYPDGQLPQLLDIVSIPISGPVPAAHQTENHVIAPGSWIKQGCMSALQAETLLDHPPTLWVNRDSSSAGVLDRVTAEESRHLHGSLLLIQPDDFRVETGTRYSTGQRLVRASFEYNGIHYNLSVTDAVVRRSFAQHEPGQYPMDAVYICVSLTLPFDKDGRCHKLVAGIIPARL